MSDSELLKEGNDNSAINNILGSTRVGRYTEGPSLHLASTSNAQLSHVIKISNSGHVMSSRDRIVSDHSPAHDHLLDQLLLLRNGQ